MSKRNRSEIRFADKDDISPHLFCPICQDIFMDPRHISCGHTFCFNCIKQWFRRGGAHCPVCRSRVSRFEMKKDLIPKKIIEDCEVYCSNESCDWLGTYGNLESHLKKCPQEKRKKIELNEEIACKDPILIDDEPARKATPEIINVEGEYQRFGFPPNFIDMEIRRWNNGNMELPISEILSLGEITDYGA